MFLLSFALASSVSVQEVTLAQAVASASVIVEVSDLGPNDAKGPAVARLVRVVLDRRDVFAQPLLEVGSQVRFWSAIQLRLAALGAAAEVTSFTVPQLVHARTAGPDEPLCVLLQSFEGQPSLESGSGLALVARGAVAPCVDVRAAM